MRRLPAVLGTLGLTALALVGCSSSPTAAQGCDRTASADTGAVDLVETSGAFGAQPDTEIQTPLYTDQTEYADVITGDGPSIVSTDQAAVIDITLYDGQSGDTLAATTYDDELSNVQQLSAWDASLPGLSDALLCATQGSRVVIALDADGTSDDFDTQVGLDEDASTVAVVDVQKVYLDRADGADQYNDAAGMPTIVRAPDGRPGIIIPAGAVPTEQSVQVLKRGDGAEVQDDDVVRVAYTQVDWETGDVSATSWDGAPEALDMSTASAQFSDALLGQTVGSQIVLVVPSDATDGAAGADVWVFDILGIDGPED